MVMGSDVPREDRLNFPGTLDDGYLREVPPFIAAGHLYDVRDGEPAETGDDEVPEPDLPDAADVAQRDIASWVDQDLDELDAGGVIQRDPGADTVAVLSDAMLGHALDRAAGLLGSVRPGNPRRDLAGVSAADVEIVIEALREAVRQVGREPVVAIVRGLAADRDRLQALLFIRENPDVPAEAKAEVKKNPRKRLFLAGGLLLAAGIGMPELAGPSTEAILTNEVAAGSLLAAIAALMSRS
jgi:hypothetical protein